MKTKQIVGMAVAALLFILVCGAGVLVNSAARETLTGEAKTASGFFGSMMSSETEPVLPTDPFVGLVRVEGTILDTGSPTMFSQTVGYDHQGTLALIDSMMASQTNKGILLFVNSPGGGVYESDELYLKLQEYRKQTGRPVWTYMGNEACSGGYYISMASDKIFANRNSWTGCIGVIMSVSNYKELMDKIGLKTIYFASGPNKTIGAPDLDMTEEQAQILQSLVDESYGQFLSIVSEGRKIPEEQLRPIADGRTYSARQAMELNLIDGIQTYEETSAQMAAALGDDVFVYEPVRNTFSWSSLFSMVQKAQPRSDLEVFSEFLKTEGSGVPMYYADRGIR